MWTLIREREKGLGPPKLPLSIVIQSYHFHNSSGTSECGFRCHLAFSVWLWQRGMVESREVRSAAHTDGWVFLELAPGFEKPFIFARLLGLRIAVCALSSWRGLALWPAQVFTSAPHLSRGAINSLIRNSLSYWVPAGDSAHTLVVRDVPAGVSHHPRTGKRFEITGRKSLM